MTKRMLIDATHHEETRVVVMDGNKLVEFDYESQFRRQLKGNIFLVKVTRVEPSLQAAFVNFGGNRHGFLPFAEIHPDYYRIPVADREALLAEQRALEEAAAAREDDEFDDAPEGEMAQEDGFVDDEADEIIEEIGVVSKGNDQGELSNDLVADETGYVHEDVDLDQADRDDDDEDGEDDEENNDIIDTDDETAPPTDQVENNQSDINNNGDEQNAQEATDPQGGSQNRGRRGWRGRRMGSGKGRYMGARRNRDEITEDGPAGLHARFRRRYKIQEVIKRGQIMLVQVSKEERGNKGAAVTTYLSLPGRYCVLMPNSPRGGGVSRKIGNYADRRRLKDMLKMLAIPSGMSVILRTAGVERTEAEIKRDYDYLQRLWDNIREMTLQSNAPALIYEEGDLIKRSIRDIYSRDVDELLVSGEKGYQEARDFIGMLMPGHVERVQLYTNDKIPLFQRYQVEGQINEIGEPIVQLKSGGYIVINQTEALVAVDVNSGRATKERHIEETALKTNLEAAEEIARQLRLRDLGGLVVIDFIDMEDRRNNMKVERRLKDALASDRARIQVSRISTFGLLELSRQRLNPSLTEAQFQKCPHCHGFGFIRSVDSAAILALRALEEEGVRARATRVTLHIPNNLALYILNDKRDMLATIETRYGFKVMISVDESLAPSGYLVEPMKQDVAVIDVDNQESPTDETEPTTTPRAGAKNRHKKPVGMEQALEDQAKNWPDQDQGDAPHGNVAVDDDLENEANFNRVDVEPDGQGSRENTDRRPRQNNRAVRPGGRGGNRGPDQQNGPDRGANRGRGGANGGRGRSRDRDQQRPKGNDNRADRAGAPMGGPVAENISIMATASELPAPRSTEPGPEKPKATYFVAKRRTAPAADTQNAAATDTPPAPVLASMVIDQPNPPTDPKAPKKKGWWGR